MFTLPLLTVAQSGLQCPVCYCLYTDPVCLPCSHTFCRACVLRCLETRPQCPLCNRVVATPKRLLTPLPTLNALSILVRAAARDGAQFAASTVPAAPLSVTSPATARPSTPQHTPQATHHPDPTNATEIWTAPDPAAAQTITATQPLSLPASDPASCVSLANGRTTVGMAPPTCRLGVHDDGDILMDDPSSSATPTVAAIAEVTPRLDRTTSHATTPARTDAALIAPLVAREVPSLPQLLAPAISHDVLLTDPDARYTLTLEPPLSRVNIADMATAITATTGAPPTSSARDAALAAIDDRFRGGMCFLCGLDLSSRSAMRSFLYWLLTVRSEASGCTADDLRTVTEHSLSLDLGPLWRLTCEVTNGAQEEGKGQEKNGNVSGDGTRMRNAAADTHQTRVAIAATVATSSQAFSAVAHQNCLAWCGMLEPAYYFRGRPHLCTPHEAQLVLQALAWSPPSVSATSASSSLARASRGSAVEPDGSVNPAQALAQDVRSGTLCWCHILPTTITTATSITASPKTAASPRKRGRSARRGDINTPPLDAQRRQQDRARLAWLLVHGTPDTPPPSSAWPSGAEASAASDLFSRSGQTPGASPETVDDDLQRTTTCSVCGRPSRHGLSVRACMASRLDSRGHHECGQRFHLPCALLAGADRCIVFGLDEEAAAQANDEQEDGSGEANSTTTTGDAHHNTKTRHTRSVTPPPDVTVWCGTCHRKRTR